jgi:Arc/MetJ-type ribon-helix-helix transcriptional regulator
MVLRPVSIRLTEEQRQKLDELVDSDRYPNRSEFVRAAIDDALDTDGDGDAVEELRRRRAKEKSPEGVLGN